MFQNPDGKQWALFHFYLKKKKKAQLLKMETKLNTTFLSC